MRILLILMIFKLFIGYIICIIVNINLKKGDSKKEKISYKDLRYKFKYIFFRYVKNKYVYFML